MWVHGGPGGQTRTGYSATIQHLVNHGYAVLGANNRGSSGYGKTFFHMDDKRHGEEDLQDIVWGRKYLESLDWVDGEKIGVIGGSYGGYMVNWIVSHTDRFAAAVSQRSGVPPGSWKNAWARAASPERGSVSRASSISLRAAAVSPARSRKTP
mgnify:CR=1 FL=1